jgi:hypothetical protein
MKTLSKSIFVFFLFFNISSAFAQGDLLVYPKKLVFEGTQERVKILNFKNEGIDSATYKLSYIENRMTEDGNLEIIETPDEGQLFASPYLRFYPRSITLAPGEIQTVKIQLTRTSSLDTGEYRSHLYIRAEEKNQVRGDKETIAKQQNIAIQLKPIYGISIPNIVRIGDTQVKAELKNIHILQDIDTPVLSMTVYRDGNQSLNASLEVVHLSTEGVQTPIGKQTVVIYPPLGVQNVNMKLNAPEGLELNSGRLAITITEREGEKKLLASENLDL